MKTSAPAPADQPDPIHSLPQLLSVRETADFLGLSTRTIHRWIKSDLIAAIQPFPGGHIRIHRTEIAKLLLRRPTG